MRHQKMWWRRTGPQREHFPCHICCNWACGFGSYQASQGANGVILKVTSSIVSHSIAFEKGCTSRTVKFNLKKHSASTAWKLSDIVVGFEE